MKSTKSRLTTILLSIFLGGLGIDRFYLGYTGYGILKLMTGGCLGVLWVLDIIYICTGKLKPADGSDYIDDLGPVSSVQSNNNISTADEIVKYKALLDAGAISQEEFEMKKKQLMQTNNNISTADEIIQYRDLLNVGAITQEEFDLKKKQLMDL